MITSLINQSSLSTPFRGMANSTFDVMRRPQQENFDVKNFASEIFNIKVLKNFVGSSSASA